MGPARKFCVLNVPDIYTVQYIAEGYRDCGARKIWGGYGMEYRGKLMEDPVAGGGLQRGMAKNRSSAGF